MREVVSGSLPAAGFGEKSILDNLLSALNCSGSFSVYANVVGGDRGPLSVQSIGNRSVQACAYEVFSSNEMPADPGQAMTQKLVITLGDELSSRIRPKPDWYGQLCKLLIKVKQHTAFCVFRTYVGGWTTSYRMHEPVRRDCLFGCREGKDELMHYLVCSPLWQIAAGALGIEAPIPIGERLCVVNPSVERVHLLALACHTYHHTKSRAKELDDFSPARLQRVAFESSVTFVGHIK